MWIEKSQRKACGNNLALADFRTFASVETLTLESGANASDSKPS